MTGFQRIGVIGAGAWGAALALVASRAGRDVTLWGRDLKRASERLPGVSFPNSVRRTEHAGDLSGVDAALLVVPAQSLASALPQFGEVLGRGVPLILCAKGIERDSGRFLSACVAELLPGRPIGALSGPSFAQDVAAGLPTAVTLALAEREIGEALAAGLASNSFRPYWTDDLIGVEAGGALKNVYAIAAGVVIGRGLGESARAALIARGFAELVRLGRAIGARPETFGGLSGLGDLVLTATGTQSRNLRFGLALGRGDDPDTARAAIGTVEGAATALAVSALAARLGVDMPVASAVGALVEGRVSAADVAAGLMARPLRAE